MLRIVIEDEMELRAWFWGQWERQPISGQLTRRKLEDAVEALLDRDEITISEEGHVVETSSEEIVPGLGVELY